MRRRVQLGAIKAATIAAFALLFFGVAYLNLSELVGRLGRQHLGELTETALRWVEAEVASADGLLGGLAREVPLTCESASLQAVRLHVYQHSVLKDVRIAGHDGAIRCSAYAETLEFDRDWPSRAEMLASKDDGPRLFRVQQFASDALGVFRDVGPTRSLAAILAIDPLQLDVLPDTLRRHGRVALRLADGTTVGTSGVVQGGIGQETVRVTRASTVFPVMVVIDADADALQRWTAIPMVPALVACGALGALFGVLVLRLAARPVDAPRTLDAAIAARQFRPYYQPIFDLADRRIVGCEVLMRWVLPDGRVVPPSAFIPLAESTGRIDRMTWQLIVLALAELGTLANTWPDFRASFNIVPRHMLSPGFSERLWEIVERAGVDPGQIVLELTERDELEDLDLADRVLGELRGIGFRIALDDVGVGHSGLSHIQGLHPDTLKIDKFFVDAVGRDMSAGVVIDMLARLADELGMRVVAEGVETEAQVEALRACGVGLGQGYLVSPPVPLASFEALLARHPAQSGPVAPLQSAA